MKLLAAIFKFFIDIISFVIKRNADALKYLFSVSLRKEVKNYYENGYFLEYRHIDKVIELAIRFKLINDYCVLDVGGMNGTTAKMFADKLPFSVVYTFEPIRQSFNSILDVAKNYKNIMPINKAVGNESGNTKINIASRISSSSIYSLVSDPNSSIFREILNKVNTEEIIITRLDDEIPLNLKISIVKIDVQGFELEVLKGAENCLKRTGLVLLEMNNHDGYQGSPKYFEIDQYLRNSGFTLFDIFPSTHDNSRLVEWDSIYINSTLL